MKTGSQELWYRLKTPGLDDLQLKLIKTLIQSYHIDLNRSKIINAAEKLKKPKAAPFFGDLQNEYEKSIKIIISNYKAPIYLSI